jgi:hypothetical protein
MVFESRRYNISIRFAVRMHSESISESWATTRSAGPRVMLLAGDAGCSAVPQNSKPARTHRGTEAATEAEARDRSSPAFLVRADRPRRPIRGIATRVSCPFVHLSELAGPWMSSARERGRVAGVSRGAE